MVCVKQVEKRGAEGLLDAVVSSLKYLGLDDANIKAKYSDLTTDGESANTGRKSGLWARLEEYVGLAIKHLTSGVRVTDLIWPWKT